MATINKPIEPWDGREPITEALERRSLHQSFQLAIDGGKRAEAIGFLVAVGADADTAEGIVSKILPPANRDGQNGDAR